jgi:membrane protein YqaA with SNARE-associated domain
MNTIWLYVFPIFLLQESVLTNTLILTIHEQGLNIWAVHLLWICATILGILLGYALGCRVEKKAAGTKIGTRLEEFTLSVERAAGKRGKPLMYFLVGIFCFPYVSGLVTSLLKEDIRKVILFLLAGNLVMYGVHWATALGIRSSLPSGSSAIVALIMITLVLVSIFKLLFGKALK